MTETDLGYRQPRRTARLWPVGLLMLSFATVGVTGGIVAISAGEFARGMSPDLSQPVPEPGGLIAGSPTTTTTEPVETTTTIVDPLTTSTTEADRTGECAIAVQWIGSNFNEVHSLELGESVELKADDYCSPTAADPCGEGIQKVTAYINGKYQERLGKIIRPKRDTYCPPL